MGSMVQVLDCTLRDGGYINSWNFGAQIISGIIKSLVEAKIDIIECGFIRNAEHDSDSSVFNSMDEVSKIIEPKSKSSLYAIMIEHHNNLTDVEQISLELHFVGMSGMKQDMQFMN